MNVWGAIFLGTISNNIKSTGIYAYMFWHIKFREASTGYKMTVFWNVEKRTASDFKTSYSKRDIALQQQTVGLGGLVVIVLARGFKPGKG
jgi:hypothetical protein